MILMSLEEFNDQTTPGMRPLEKNYKGKYFKAGPVFSLNSSKAAQSYCQKSSSENGGTSILVEERNFFRVWTEIFSEEQNDSARSKSILEEGEVSLNSLIVEAGFIKICQQKLAVYIGPIAPMVCKKTIARNPNLTRAEFVEILAEKIPDPIQAIEFTAELLE